ncbi:hypothetical protein BC748_2902 [Flavobacterium dankookense]|uniref:Uncharacterized protein n=1 Tax=Flavobacterium dankookense TaxID=706186 RepID=A0A4V3CRM5_9FLAO|nr:hypothetical protein BC748_2902 [Flavobacterium dankookense]
MPKRWGLYPIAQIHNPSPKTKPKNTKLKNPVTTNDRVFICKAIAHAIQNLKTTSSTLKLHHFTIYKTTTITPLTH